MKIIIGILIFCLVLFIYLHIQFHLKTGEDLEMYEVDMPSKDKLEEICDLRQPVLFDFECSKIIESTNASYIYNYYHAFDVKIRDTRENDTNSDIYVHLPLNSAIKLFHEDKNSAYFSENNNDFLQETGVVKSMSYNDEFIRPYMVSKCKYDILFGSKSTCTPFRYELNYRNYLLLTQGIAKIKLAPPHSIKYLYPIYDYENFEFSSPVNPWNPQPRYIADFNKIKCLEFTLLPGKTLYIPAYWWYSIQFVSENTSISSFNYSTYMNNLAIVPYEFLHFLQILNVERKTAKIINISELNKSEGALPVDKEDISATNIDDLPNQPVIENNEQQPLLTE